ncbi:MAG: hypothetical protein LBD06_03050 [Candidatus Accumulibacter sp.]|nr:hypothetical protein [Accumulibacter sp.]
MRGQRTDKFGRFAPSEKRKTERPVSLSSQMVFPRLLNPSSRFSVLAPARSAASEPVFCPLESLSSGTVL